MAILLTDSSVQMQTALGTNITITGISQASEAVVTGTHSLSVGDIVVISGVVGMTQINGKVVRVKSVNTTVDFTCEGLDSTGYTAWVSGGVANEVTLGASFDNITNLSLPDQQANRLTITAISDNEEQQLQGLDAAPTGSFSINADPLAATSVELAAASDDKLRRAFVVTLKNGYVGIFNTFVSGGAGIDGAVRLWHEINHHHHQPVCHLDHYPELAHRRHAD